MRYFDHFLAGFFNRFGYRLGDHIKTNWATWILMKLHILRKQHIFENNIHKSQYE